MKNTTTRPIVRVALFGLLASLLLTAFVVLQAADNPKADTKSSSLARDMIGTWVLVGKPGKAEETPGKGSRLKFITGKHWNITQADAETGQTIFHHGGTYTLNANEYAETVEYANESTTNLIKETFKFTVKVEGDTYTQIGIGNPWSEVWKRAK